MPKRLLFILLLFILCACREQQENSVRGIALGTYFSITYTGEEAHQLYYEIDSLLQNFSREFSIFDTMSMVSKINANEEVELNADLVTVFTIAQQVSASTDGAFDITVGALVDAWGFGKTEGNVLTQQQVDSIKTFTGYEKVKIENGKIVKADNRIQLNFNAIAKGYAVDKVVEYMLSKGYRNFVVDIGGEIVAKGNKHGKEWKIGIQVPAASKKAKAASSYDFKLKDKAVATSGNYRNYYEKDGKRYAHTINPKTGYTEQKNLLSATVIAGNCCLADAYATAFMVMGLERSLSFLELHPELAAYFIYDENGKYKIKKSGNFPERQ